jgi:hypothetical protein
MGVIAQAVYQQAIDATQGLIRERPDLGDQFINISRDAVNEHIERGESRRRAGEPSNVPQ